MGWASLSGLFNSNAAPAENSKHFTDVLRTVELLHYKAPQLKRFGTGKLTLLVPTLLCKAGRKNQSHSSTSKPGKNNLSLSHSSHLLSRGDKKMSGMQIVSNTFCEIYSGELQVTCAESMVWSYTLILCAALLRKQLRMSNHSANSLHRWALSLPFHTFMLALALTTVIDWKPPVLLSRYLVRSISCQRNYFFYLKQTKKIQQKIGRFILKQRFTD